ncbi:hypothetical protein K469DRAFT_633651 [Zopfia rhizophila CBS 207.26]|uniref:GPI anchored protein n=1 Tax=Zopfia rhizophila CBS 207.26 TaxID=1314779 RepID=A0A6A6E155_9PEZI|nr:hypothetical protein K469DRAFT_633651 [Zopfia rhizophila CBS 207.26]
MQLPNSLLSLPTTVILLLCVSPVVPEQRWPYNLPKHMKYFPEDEIHVKRDLSIQERLLRERPIGVKKMSSDEGEMFFLDNWIFEQDERTSFGKRLDSVEHGNNSITSALPPLRPHSESRLLGPQFRFALRDSLLVRGFKCPEGTNDCSSIGAPNSCCGTSDTCISIPDTGFGTVGCCPRGMNCGGAISCDADNGYSSCPNSPNGGCCLPGYSCQDIGCVISGTSVTFVQPSTSAARPSSTAVVVIPTSPSSRLAPTSSSTCSSGWFSCPTSLGGGCCQNGQRCATGTSCLAPGSSSASSVAPSAPVRPTSNEPTTTEPSISLCPTGFYVCSAYYPSGCCRVGRDCQTTGTCVRTSSGTVIVSNGITIVAPTGASFATTAPPQRGSCPTGWFSCAANLGGNCCPNGFSCGEHCTATPGGNTQVAGKVAPSTASSFSNASIWALISGGIAIGIGMLIL